MIYLILMLPHQKRWMHVNVSLGRFLSLGSLVKLTIFVSMCCALLYKKVVCKKGFFFMSSVLDKFQSYVHNLIVDSSLNIRYEFTSSLKSAVEIEKSIKDGNKLYTIYVLGNTHETTIRAYLRLLLGFTACEHVLRYYRHGVTTVFPKSVYFTENFEEFDMVTSENIYSKYLAYKRAAGVLKD